MGEIIKPLKKMFINKQDSDNYVQQVAGDKLDSYAFIYEKCGDDLQYIEEILLHYYILDESDGNKEKITAFRQGLSSIKDFFSECKELKDIREGIKKERDSKTDKKIKERVLRF